MELLDELNEKIDCLDDKLIDEKKALYLEYINKDLAEAYLYLADLYYFDLDDVEEALKYYEIAASKEIGQAIYMKGIIFANSFYREQNIDKAKECLELAANKYEVDDAIYELGFSYFNGINGFDKDYDKAFNYFLASAKNKNPEALCSLAQCYANGLGVAKDLEKAYKTLKEAFLELNNEE